MTHLNRRRFLQRSLAASTVFSTFAISGTKSSGQVIGANDALRVGVAGLRGRGGSHIGSLLGIKGVKITYLIDPDSRQFGRAKGVEDKSGVKPKTVQDVREALDDKDLDAITIATPNHWHALMTIWACQAGKDVFVEKPCSHNVHEGRVAVEAARKYGRIVQHGTQSRSNGGLAKRAGEIAEGKHGKLLVSRGTCYKRRGSIGFKEAGDGPKELDFNVWLGPAPQQPHHGNLVHYNWHWFWDFGNGDIGNQGVHQMDIARWMIPGAAWPKSVLSLGGRFGYEDQAETPNTQLTIFDYGQTQLVFEVRGLPTKGGIGNTQHFDKQAAVEPIPVTEHPGVKSPTAPRGSNHMGNFIDAVRSRKQEELNADILEGHISSGLCHLANISYRLGEEVPFSKSSKAFGDNKVAYEDFARLQEHLQENKVPLDGTACRVGRKLEFDAQTETFKNDSQANELLSRNYRAPFVVPEKIA